MKMVLVAGMLMMALFAAVLSAVNAGGDDTADRTTGRPDTAIPAEPIVAVNPWS